MRTQSKRCRLSLVLAHVYGGVMKRLCSILWMAALPILAQDRAAINGTVTDASGALVAGASVELKSAETGLQRGALTDQGGRFQITTLPVGSYSVRMTKNGFRPT